MKTENIPYKIYLSESEMPQNWYNVRADMKNKPAPPVNPGTGKPMGFDDLRPVFCDELIEQELDNNTPYIPIPQEIRDFYKMYRPSPLVRAYCLEEKLGTPAKIYYKFEGNNTSGSHKLNSAIAQAYYAKKQGLKGVTTETGAGQWGTALSMACAYLGLDLKVFMVKCSYEQKPFRREVMRTYGASVTPSPSTETEIGRRILAEHPDIQLENDDRAQEFKVTIPRPAQESEPTTQKDETTTHKGRNTTHKSTNATHKSTNTTRKEANSTQKDLNTTQKNVLAYFKKNPRATKADAADTLGGITENGIKFIIGKLQQKGLIKRVGGRKYGEWQVLI